MYNSAKQRQITAVQQDPTECSRKGIEDARVAATAECQTNWEIRLIMPFDTE